MLSDADAAMMVKSPNPARIDGCAVHQDLKLAPPPGASTLAGDGVLDADPVPRFVMWLTVARAK